MASDTVWNQGPLYMWYEKYVESLGNLASNRFQENEGCGWIMNLHWFGKPVLYLLLLLINELIDWVLLSFDLSLNKQHLIL